MSDTGTILHGAVEQFNPYSMRDEDIQYLATGRESELKTILKAVADNSRSNGSNQHLMIIGPRGMGKSFLIQLAKVKISVQFPHLLVVQLPEEQSNIKGAAAFLDVITQGITGQSRQQQFAKFGAEAPEAWNRSLQGLRRALESRKAVAPNLQVVVTVENFDLLLEKIFKLRADESKFRALLAEESGLMFLLSTLRGDLDLDSGQRLFHAFNHIRLKPWNIAQLENYFCKRREVDKIPLEMKARYQAVIRFVGGSPRMAVILNDLIDRLENPVSSAKLLDRFTDQFTPYYQNLMRLMPANTEALFDALIRGGEPCSQSELAARVGMQQNSIAESFSWLRAKEIVFGEREKGGRAMLYWVADRLFVQFFRKRYIYFDAWSTPLMAIAELLEQLYSTEEKLKMARSYFEFTSGVEGAMLGRMYLASRGVAVESVATKTEDMNDLIRLLTHDEPIVLTDYGSEEAARAALERACMALSETIRTDDGSQNQFYCTQLAGLVRDSRILSFEEKMALVQATIHTYEVMRIDVISRLLILANQTVGDLKADEIIKSYLVVVLSLPKNFLLNRYKGDEESIYNNYIRYAKHAEDYIVDCLGGSFLFSCVQEWVDGLLEVEELILSFMVKYNHNYVLFLAYMVRAILFMMIEQYGNSKFVLIKMLDLVDLFEDRKIEKEAEHAKTRSQLYYQLGLVSWKQQDVEEAIKNFSISVDIILKAGIKERSITVGYYAAALLVHNQPAKAGKVLKRELKENSENNHLLFKSLTVAIYFSEKHHGRAEGFAVAKRLLLWLARPSMSVPLQSAIVGLVFSLFEMGNSYLLIADIIEEIVILGRKHSEIAMLADISSMALRYLMANQDDALIQKVDPDEQVFIKTMIKDASKFRLT